MSTTDRTDGEYNQVTTFPEMLGRTCVDLQGREGDGELVFTMSDGSVFKFWHQDDCCESVAMHEVHGDLEDLVGAPLVEAEEVDASNEPAPKEGAESFTWTFYKFRTSKGSVTVRWLGRSNGYYSETVSFAQELQPRLPALEVVAAAAPPASLGDLGDALDDLEKQVH